jgi:predicted PurR-regulated permease PerM
MIETPVSQPYPWTFRRVVWATLVFALVVFCFWLVYHFYEVAFTLFVAIVFGTVIRPISDWLYQRGIPRMMGVILIYLVLFVLFVGFLWLVFPLIFTQSASIAGELPGYYRNIRQSLTGSPNPLFVRFGELLPVVLPALLPVPVPPSDQEVVASAEQMMQYMTLVSRAFFAAVVVPVLTLYWTLDGPRIIKSLLLLVPQDQRESISDLVAAMESKIGFYLAGQGVLCLVIGFLALIAYALIGLPNALVLALIAAVMEAVPMVGPFLGAIPAALVALSIGPEKLIWVIVATLVIQQLENSLLVPRIMKRTVGVNPFVTLLALFAFGNLFGIVGALMAIPLAAMIQLVLDHFVFKQTTVELEPSEGRNYVSRLRYEAQDLIGDLRKQARHKKRGTENKIVQVEQVMDEIESITTNLDEMLAQVNAAEEA